MRYPMPAAHLHRVRFNCWTLRVPVSAPLLFTANDCLDIGIALGSPVSLDYHKKVPFKFNGKIDKVNVKYIPQPTK